MEKKKEEEYESDKKFIINKYSITLDLSCIFHY